MRIQPLYPKIYIPSDISSVPGLKAGGVAIELTVLEVDGEGKPKQVEGKADSYRIAVSEDTYNNKVKPRFFHLKGVELAESEYVRL